MNQKPVVNTVVTLMQRVAQSIQEWGIDLAALSHAEAEVASTNEAMTQKEVKHTRLAEWLSLLGGPQAQEIMSSR